MAGNKATITYEMMTGPQKAAVFLMSLPDSVAAEVLKRLEMDEVREVTGTMNEIGHVLPKDIEKIFREFAEHATGQSGTVGNYNTTRKLLESAFSQDQAQMLLDDLNGPKGKTMWEKLGNIPDQILSNYLKNEYPQTIAVILSKIKADHAGRVLVNLFNFKQDLALEVIFRLLQIDAIQKDVLDNVEKTLRAEFMSNLTHAQRQEPHEFVAHIFNSMDQEKSSKFLNALTERNSQAAEKIQKFMFRFEDLTRVPAQGIAALIEQADQTDLAKALKGASEILRNLFFDSMSQRQRQMMEENIKALPMMRLRDIDAAQQSVLAVAKRLKDEGTIIVLDDGEDGQVVY